MWLNQVQIFQLTEPFNYPLETVIQKLESLAFSPCLPSMAATAGWAPAVAEEDAPLVRAVNGHILLCLQIEEKILPASVIRQELQQKIKEIEAAEGKKIRQKEKLSLKDDIIITLLPRAFTKISQVYGYIDTNNQWLVLGTTHAKKTEQFISIFKKSITENIKPLELKKISPTLTHFITTQNYPTTFSIEKACVLQDPNQQNRIIRCQQQDLFASSIQSLIKDGCEIKQLAFSWHDRVNFMLAEGFLLTGIKFQDEITGQANDLEPETRQQQLDADFLIMTETLSKLLTDLLSLFTSTPSTEKSTEPATRAPLTVAA